MKKIAVIGGGISGLSTAYYLGREGLQADLYEKDRPGGSIQSVRKGNSVLDTGPNSLRDKTGELNNLIHELDLEKEVLDVSEAFKTRCIVRNGELQFLGPSPLSFFRSGILSGRGKLRLFSEPFRSAVASEDESIRSFLERRIGKEAVDYLVDPVFSGIYAGNISKLSKNEILPEVSRYERDFGSVFKGMIRSRKKNRIKPRVLNFRNGIQSLTEAMADKSDFKIVNEGVTSIKHHDDKFELHSGSGLKEYDTVISCVPAYVLSELISDTKLSSVLMEIEYPAVHSIQLLFKKEDLNDLPSGFGFLVPREEELTILGAIWKSSIFPELTDDRYFQFNLLCGGAHSEISDADLENIENKVIREFKKIMKISAEPAEKYSKYWPKAIPQFNVGYKAIRNEIVRFEKQTPGFHIGSNFRWGVSVPECINGARRLVKQIIT